MGARSRRRSIPLGRGCGRCRRSRAWWRSRGGSRRAGRCRSGLRSIERIVDFAQSERTLRLGSTCEGEGGPPGRLRWSAIALQPQPLTAHRWKISATTGACSGSGCECGSWCRRRWRGWGRGGGVRSSGSRRGRVRRSGSPAGRSGASRAWSRGRAWRARTRRTPAAARSAARLRRWWGRRRRWRSGSGRRACAARGGTGRRTKRSRERREVW